MTKNVEPVSSGDSQGRAVLQVGGQIKILTFWRSQVEALAAPDFIVER
jgi:hypothetical protein